MSTDFLSILLENVTEDAQYIRREYARRSIEWDEANSRFWTLRNILSGVRHDAKRTCTPEEAEAISDALRTVCEIHDNVGDTYLRIQETKLNIIKELRKEVCE